MNQFLLITAPNNLPPVATWANYRMAAPQQFVSSDGINTTYPQSQYAGWTGINLMHMDANDHLDLKGENWLSWLAHQRQILDQFDLLPFVDTPIEFTPGAKGDSLRTHDKLIVSNIFMNVTSEVRQILDPSTAFNCWTDLTLRFQDNLLMAQFFLEKELNHTLMQEGSDLENHYRILELKHRTLANAGKTISDLEFITIFLASLPESFESFCQSVQWENMTVTRLLQHVRHTAVRLRNWGTSSTFTANYKAKPFIDRSKLVCSHCNGKRHTENECWADSGKNAANRPANYRGKAKPKANITTADVPTATGVAPSASLLQVPTELNAAFTVSHSLNTITSNAHYLHDSGANCHLFIDRNDFYDYAKIKSLPICTATPNVPLIVRGCGSILVCFRYKDTETNFLLKDVLHVPNATENLVSASALQDAQVTQIIDEHSSLYLQFKSKIFAQGVRCGDNLFALDLRVLRTKGPIALITVVPAIPFLEAHKRLNHIGFNKLECMQTSNMCGGLSIAPRGDSFCNQYLQANMK